MKKTLLYFFALSILLLMFGYSVMQNLEINTNKIKVIKNEYSGIQIAN